MDRCQQCGGLGKMKSKRSIKIIIPPGFDDGATMKLQGEGNYDKQSSLPPTAAVASKDGTVVKITTLRCEVENTKQEAKAVAAQLHGGVGLHNFGAWLPSMPVNWNLMIDLWILMGTPDDERHLFDHVTCNISSSVDEVTIPGALTLDLSEQEILQADSSLRRPEEEVALLDSYASIKSNVVVGSWIKSCRKRARSIVESDDTSPFYDESDDTADLCPQCAVGGSRTAHATIAALSELILDGREQVVDLSSFTVARFVAARKG
ncbi:hypothetical protein Nepgr_013779 [Nepenthes gracilis]|uniref:Uncharacterized protein n=1 Tax=Nepenthes gracilis TaxID=150966 RepID=A0AAD3XP99_NEPGR|nr:hypothetical protein Nepgr_013779 [Nepenthes gracilis]